ncbi:hypothetical protein ACO2Q0_19450 [Phenylobacterium sp. VNQ135]|uniref:hypothetical protein n=1 Tax=Phenylobacterium sp. VNQ135 TaxID=3400922 RepID=UPI003C0A72B9
MRFAVGLSCLALVAAAPAFAQGVSNGQAGAPNAVGRDPCPFSASSPGCPSLRMGPRPGALFDAFERRRERNTLYASIQASLDRGDCENARAKAVDDGRHELAARIGRACKGRS